MLIRYIPKWAVSDPNFLPNLSSTEVIIMPFSAHVYFYKYMYSHGKSTVREYLLLFPHYMLVHHILLNWAIYCASGNVFRDLQPGKTQNSLRS